jgi:hypothetical protein
MADEQTFEVGLKLEPLSIQALNNEGYQSLKEDTTFVYYFYV